METIVQDLRYAARTLLRQPGFTAVAVFTLAVGIGANTAIYSVVDATLLRTLPYQDPDRLMRVSLTTPSAPGRGSRQPNDDMSWSYPKYQTFRDSQQVYSSTAVYRSQAYNLTGVGDPERLAAEIVGADYFPLLGVRAEVGRTFLPEEDVTPEKDFVAVMSHGLWERRYGADPQIVGKTINLDSRPFTIVGVLPAGFQALSGGADLWMPAHIFNGPDELDQAGSHSWSMVARLKPGVSPAQAMSAVSLLGPRIDETWPMGNFRGWGAKARILNETRMEPTIRKSVLVLFGAVSFVLLIACVNIANLLLARGSSRSREMAVRLAIGANRGRLVRQLLTESVLLALVGAAASVALAYAGVRALEAINPAAGDTFTFGKRLSGLTVVGLRSIHLDARALLFTLGIALATGVLFGLIPALAGARADVTGALKSGGSRAGIAANSGKSVLVVVEVALAVVLLTGAGLMLKSFGRLIATRSGVDPENVLTMRINLPNAMFATGSTGFFEPLERRVAALPGVLSAGLSNCHALAGRCNGTIIWFRDRTPVPPGTEPGVGVQFVSPDYFKTMRIPLLKGRWFTAADRKGTSKVVVINETAARRFWPGEDPVGRPIGVGQGGFGDRAEIIGVVGDVRYGQMDEPPQPDVYISHLQASRGSMVLFARTVGNPAAMTQAMEHEVHALNQDLPVFDVKTMNERIRDATSRARFSAILLAVFAAIALILAAVGIYGVMSYLVTQRTREIGIRIALGAGSAEVLALVVRRGAVLAAAGIGVGVFGALVTTRVLATLLYEVKPGDPATYVTISAVLAVVALVASYIPARRASSVDPSSALRAD
jgi:putative ABC transport system permease protein